MGRKLNMTNRLAVAGLLASLLAAAPATAADELPAGLKLQAGEEGRVLATSSGAAVYRLDLDRVAKRRKAGSGFSLPRCADVCQRLWAPVAAPKDFKPGGDWGVVQSPKGDQLTYKNDPLYTFSGENFEEAAKLRIAPSYYSSYSSKPTLMVDGVPLATVYWHPAVYGAAQPAKVPAPPGVTARWHKTDFTLTDADNRRLYTAKSATGCEDKCEGLEPLMAPLAAMPVGEWRPVLSDSGDRYWSYRGRIVYGATGDEPGPGWSPILAR